MSHEPESMHQASSINHQKLGVVFFLTDWTGKLSSHMWASDRGPPYHLNLRQKMQKTIVFQETGRSHAYWAFSAMDWAFPIAYWAFPITY